MSRSPLSSSSPEELLDYSRAWLALNTLLREGRSFSGRERNCCFLNLGGARFADVSAAVGLDFPDDGRAIVPTDWDFDGDLDLWTGNGTAPRLRLLRNGTTSDNHFIAVHLQGITCNRDAIGARIELYAGADGQEKQIKSLHAGDSFLSQSSKWIHFGIGSHSTVDRLVVRWPGGASETFRGLGADRFWRVIQGTGKAQSWRPPSDRRELPASPPPVRAETDGGRVVMIEPFPMPELQYVSAEAGHLTRPLRRAKPLLVNLWATWCGPCLVELKSWADDRARLAETDVDIVAICVDEQNDDLAQHLSKVLNVSRQSQFPFEVGIPSDNLIPVLDLAQRTYTAKQRPLPLPSSLLFDSRGQLAVVYKGPVSVDQLIHDVKLLNADHGTVLAAAVPFPGRWSNRPAPIAPRKFALALYETGFASEANQYVEQLISRLESGPFDRSRDTAETREQQLGQLYKLLGAMQSDAKSYAEAAASFRSALKYSTDDPRLHIELASALDELNQVSDAAAHLEAALALKRSDPTTLERLAAIKLRQGHVQDAVGLFGESLALRNDAGVRFALANALLSVGDVSEAVQHFRESLRLRPGWPPAANNLAWTLATSPDNTIRNGSEAVRLAEQVCRATDHKVPEFLTTLAAAYAETDRFDEAIDTINTAIDRATASEKQRLVDRAREQLRSYQQRQPLRLER